MTNSVFMGYARRNTPNAERGTRNAERGTESCRPCTPTVALGAVLCRAIHKELNRIAGITCTAGKREWASLMEDADTLIADPFAEALGRNKPETLREAA